MSFNLRARLRPWPVGSLMAVVLFAAVAQADTIELVSGSKYAGRLVSRDDQSVVFEVIGASGGRSTLSFPASTVREVVVDGKVPQPAPAAPKPPETAKPADAPKPAQPKPDPTDTAQPSPSPAAQPAAPAEPTAAEIDAIINKAGRSNPDWWDKVSLNYPKTLDLTWTQHPGGWQPNKNLGAYVWGVIQPNPGKWREGIRLMHHVLTVNKDDPARLKQTQEALGRMYLKFEKDYARAAFWYRQSGGRHEAELGECYLALGWPKLAAQALSRAPASADVARVWSAMGQHNTALRVAMQLAPFAGGPGQPCRRRCEPLGGQV